MVLASWVKARALMHLLSSGSSTNGCHVFASKAAEIAGTLTPRTIGVSALRASSHWKPPLGHSNAAISAGSAVNAAPTASAISA
jgi:hypothetical protein